MSRLGLSSSEKDTLVKNELCNFILKHTGQDALSSVDEIVMTYIIGVLESLESPAEQEDFDVNEFAEMMSAYIPTFSTINTSEIHEWMIQLAGWLKEDSKKNENRYALEDILFKTRRLSVATKNLSKSNCDLESKSGCQDFHSRRSSYHRSCSCSSSQSEDDDKSINVSVTGMSHELKTLTEMFPTLHIMELKQFLSKANGDCEEAVQLILQKMEATPQLTESVIVKNLKHKVTGCHEKIEDKKLREQILNRYAYIDQDDDAREHKPVAPKTEPKKLIRYRDNKIVSIKGERYSEVKGRDTGDTK